MGGGDLAHLVQDMEGQFRRVLHNLQLKGLLGDHSAQGANYFQSHPRQSPGASASDAHVVHHDTRRGEQQQQQHFGEERDEEPVVRGERGRGPGGFFRPQLGVLSSRPDPAPAPAPAVPRGSVNALSVHTGPVSMKDKGIKFFDPKRNIKSCEKPTPNIGDYLILEDKNGLRPIADASPRTVAASTRAGHTHVSQGGPDSGSCTEEVARQCRCPRSSSSSSSRQQLAAEYCRRGQEEYEGIIRELERKVQERVKLEAKLKVLRLLTKAEKHSSS